MSSVSMNLNAQEKKDLSSKSSMTSMKDQRANGIQMTSTPAPESTRTLAPALSTATSLFDSGNNNLSSTFGNEFINLDMMTESQPRSFGYPSTPTNPPTPPGNHLTTTTSNDLGFEEQAHVFPFATGAENNLSGVIGTVAESPIGVLRDLEESGGSLLELAEDYEHDQSHVEQQEFQPKKSLIPPEKVESEESASSPVIAITTTEANNLTSNATTTATTKTKMAFSAPWTEEGRLRTRRKSSASIQMDNANPLLIGQLPEVEVKSSETKTARKPKRKSSEFISAQLEEARNFQVLHEHVHEKDDEEDMYDIFARSESPAPMPSRQKSSRDTYVAATPVSRRKPISVATPITPPASSSRTKPASKKGMKRTRTERAESWPEPVLEGGEEEDAGEISDDEWQPEPTPSRRKGASTTAAGKGGHALSKAEMKRIRNRLAARRSRERKTNRIIELEAENAKLLKDLEKTRKQVDYWMKRAK